MKIIRKYINELLKWDGYIEKASNSMLDDKTTNAGSKNHTRFARDYYKYTGVNVQAQPWCMVYLNAMLVEVIGLDNAKKMLYGELYASCTRMVNVFKANNAFYTTPSVGDFVIFTHTKTNKIAHVGLVLEVKNGRIYTIEGNTSAAAGVVDNGGMVRQKSYSISYNHIYGYCRPNYKVIEVETKDGWIKSADKWQYWQNNIQQKSLWVQSENKWDWYYIKSDGNMAENELLQIGAELFYFLKDGRMAVTNDRGALV